MTESFLIEAKLIWGGDVIAVRHVPPRAEIYVRDLGFDVPSGEEILVATRDDAGVVALRFKDGTIVPQGCRLQLQLGRTVVQLTLVADDVVPLPALQPDPRVVFGIAVAAALHFVVLALFAHGRADAGLAEEAARADLNRMVAAAEERALTDSAKLEEPKNEASGSAESRPDPAQAGNPSKNDDNRRMRITRGDDHRGATAGRPSREEVETFGILGLLARDSAGTSAGNSAFAVETGPSAMGNIFGQTIDDATGTGGLALSGAGQGGGGKGAGESIGGIGALGRVGGSGIGQGFGSGCDGCLARPHVPRAPTWTIWDGGGGAMVNGRLPPEAVQRVVRQSFGRLRGCYARGLELRPDLEGRIAVKFVIDREGNVALASAAERTLDDAAVAACVVRGFEAMSFPKPEGGIVTVVYPIVFTNTGP